MLLYISKCLALIAAPVAAMAVFCGCVFTAGVPRQSGSPARVVWVEAQPEEFPLSAQAVFWQDSFDNVASDAAYLEGTGERSRNVTLGSSGASLQMEYGPTHHGHGGRKLVFGDAPFGTPLTPDETYREVFCRFYLYYPESWQGRGPQKLSRVISFASADWTQASAVHLWDGKRNLTLEPVSGVEQDQVRTNGYNDVTNFKWLGATPEAEFDFFPQELGRWVSIEMQVRLNTPGVADGYAALWIDNKLAAERKNLDLQGNYRARGLNAIFLESHSNSFLTVEQQRYLDNFVVSRKRIGPVVAEANPLLLLDTGSPAGTEFLVELREAQGAVVWSSDVGQSNPLRVNNDSGKFHSGATALSPGWYEVRVAIVASDTSATWSPWHQAFQVR